MKLYRNIIIIVVVLGLLVTGLILVNKSHGTKPQEEKKQETEVPKPDPITVLQLDSSAIVKVAVNTASEDYTITKNGNSYKLSNAQNIKIGSFAVQSLVASYSEVISYQLVSEKTEEAALYGFDAPQGSGTISLNDGTEKIIYIGKETVSGDGNYIKLDDEDKIYSMSASEIAMLAPEYTVFVDTNIFTLDPAYTTLSYFEINKTGNTPYRFDYVIEKKDDTTLTSWKMTKPINAEANVIVLSENVLTPLESFGSCVAVDARPENLSIYGLDKPYATFTIASAVAKHKYVFGNVENGYRYFMVDDYVSVYKISVDDIAFIDSAYIDLIDRLVHIENIKDISKVEIKAPDIEYTMEISGDNRTINGKVIGDSFTKAYEAVIAMSFDSVNTTFKGGAAEATIKYTRTDGTTCTLSYVPVDELNYVVRINGSGYTVISKTTFNEAMNVVKKIYDEA